MVFLICYVVNILESSIIELTDWPGDILSSVECNENQSSSSGYYNCERSTESCASNSSVAGVVCTEGNLQCVMCYFGPP